MTGVLRPPTRSGVLAGLGSALRGGPGFDLLFALLATWLLGGLYLDGWAHNHLAETLESFITPWHGVFYAGFGATASLLIGVTILNQRRVGSTWSDAIPTGYAPSLLGVAVFAIGGVVDSIWHTLFGIEVSVDALVSPPHLLLASGLGLIVGGPLRSAWRRAEVPEGIGLVAPILSLTLTLSLLTFFTQFANPFVEPWATESNLRHHATLLEALPRTMATELAPVVGVAGSWSRRPS